MALEMDRHWFFTWTTYGTWLPGDERGFVSNVRVESDRPEIRHNIPTTPHDSNMPGLVESSRGTLRGPPIFLIQKQAEALLAQFHETASIRNWQLIAVAVMAAHVHVVVGVPGDPDPSDILGDWKSYGSRTLNRRWGKPKSETWWTESGSKRKLSDERAILSAVAYVRDQENPLVLWIHPDFLADIGPRRVP
jgi:REP element-mobilizing transposase RayT